jgi:hypothetical protein
VESHDKNIVRKKILFNTAIVALVLGAALFTTDNFKISGELIIALAYAVFAFFASKKD